MIDRISQEFAFNQLALAVRERRQAVLASNIANADTPGYKARDTTFRAALEAAANPGSQMHMRLSSPRHIPGAAQLDKGTNLMYRQPTQARLDGNTVDMDVERIAFMDNAMRYQAEVTFVSGRMKTLMAALQR